MHSIGTAPFLIKCRRRKESTSVHFLISISVQSKIFCVSTEFRFNTIMSKIICGKKTSSAMPVSNRRRSRINYTSHQLESMEAVFAVNQYPDHNSREALADAIDLKEARIQVMACLKQNAL